MYHLILYGLPGNEFFIDYSPSTRENEALLEQLRKDFNFAIAYSHCSHIHGISLFDFSPTDRDSNSNYTIDVIKEQWRQLIQHPYISVTLGAMPKLYHAIN